MGLLKNIIKSALKQNVFVPDFSKTEYDNWIDFLDKGGTGVQWKELKKTNNWKFKKDPLSNDSRFEKEFRPVFTKYYAETKQLQNAWSIMYNAKNYTGKQAEKFETACLNNILTYKEMAAIEDKYGKDHLTIVEGYKRLAMLYERQCEFEKAAAVCRDAIVLGNFEDAKNRLSRMIKKSGRTPTLDEYELLK